MFILIRISKPLLKMPLVLMCGLEKTGAFDSYSSFDQFLAFTLFSICKEEVHRECHNNGNDKDVGSEIHP